YDKMSELALTSAQATQNSSAQAVVIERAQPPLSPAFPNKPLILALGLVAAVVVGGGTIAMQEMLVTGMQTVEEAENILGIPVLAAVPKVGRVGNPADILTERPTSLFAESLRIARASILGVRGTRPPQIIALTSALPGEGKTTTALSFARTLAMNGARTLLVDCDVRRASMRGLLPHANVASGLIELLHGEATLDEVIQPSGTENLDHLLVRSPYFSSENLFGDGKMEGLLAQLRQRYESIVLDLPPLIGLADGRFIAALADVAVLVIRWNATPADAASSALGWLKSDGANPVGSIYTMVDTSAEAIGGLYYSKKYSAYYQTD
ncbi:MAG: AAA family ATPase, partial [Sphingobium sp.]